MASARPRARFDNGETAVTVSGLPVKHTMKKPTAPPFRHARKRLSRPSTASLPGKQGRRQCQRPPRRHARKRMSRRSVASLSGARRGTCQRPTVGAWFRPMSAPHTSSFSSFRATSFRHLRNEAFHRLVGRGVHKLRACFLAGNLFGRQAYTI